MKQFSILVTEQLIPEFLACKKKKDYRTITVHYQNDITDELRGSLIDLLSSYPKEAEREKFEMEVENLLNCYCPQDVVITVSYINNIEIRLLFIKEG
ncbi:MAG: hypothetical protein PHP54_02400 [Clostridia bacterium]|nr:hypothetical protein [Clostridia bacterium]